MNKRQAFDKKINQIREVVRQRPGITLASLATVIGVTYHVQSGDRIITNPNLRRMVRSLVEAGEITCERDKFATLREPPKLRPTAQMKPKDAIASTPAVKPISTYKSVKVDGYTPKQLRLVEAIAEMERTGEILPKRQLLLRSGFHETYLTKSPRLNKLYEETCQRMLANPRPPADPQPPKIEPIEPTDPTYWALQKELELARNRNKGLRKRLAETIAQHEEEKRSLLQQLKTAQDKLSACQEWIEFEPESPFSDITAHHSDGGAIA